MEQKNIFKNAKFGDKFVTRDGRIAIYHYKQENPTHNSKYEAWHNLIAENSDLHLICLSNGLHLGNHIDNPEWDDDIVSRWKNNIDEEELNKLARKECHKIEANALVKGILEDEYELRGIFRGFKLGYRKAMEE